jgi:nucleoside-diphosphate-sugar epimerase
VNPWNPAPTRFVPEDMAASTMARGFGRSVAELDPNAGSPLGIDGPYRFRPERGSIVVTGGAGFLGARVIRELLSRPGKDHIHVASRSPISIGNALRRLVGTPEALRLLLDERLKMLPVDMSGEDAVRTLTMRTSPRRVRTIIHLAAAVDAFASRERLAAANETATRNAIAFAAATGARLVHASTLSIFVSSDMDGENRETSLRDRPGRILYGGYAQSKAVADMLVEDAVGMGVNACAVRLGLLVPETREHMEQGSFLTTFRDALLSVGAVPRTYEEAAVDLTPVDQAAAALVALSEADDIPPFVHYANPASASLGMVVRATLGDHPPVIDDTDWAMLTNDLASIPRTLLRAAFRKSEFLSGHCASRPLVNADLFQSTARKYDPSTAIALGAPHPRDPEMVAKELFAYEEGTDSGRMDDDVDDA